MNMAAISSQQLYEELLSCSSEVSYEKVKLLLKNDADPCSQFGATKSSPLFLCIERNDETLLHLFLRHALRKNLGITNADGVNALMLAAKLGYLGCLNLLLSSGFSSPELINKRSRPSGLEATALMLAFTEGHVDIARVLLQNGADPTLLDSRGRSPAHIASIRGQLELLQELKQHGLQLDQVVDGLGNTPMHFCTHPHVLEFLHKEGLSPSARSVCAVVRHCSMSHCVWMLQSVWWFDTAVCPIVGGCYSHSVYCDVQYVVVTCTRMHAQSS